jgi:hypothetical protein
VDSSTGNVPVGQAALIAGWSGAFGTGVAPKAWVDITSYVQGPGLTLLNGYLFDLITSLQQGTTMPDPLIRYIYTGVSSPTDVTTDFEYEIKILFQTVVPQPYEVPFG